MSGKPHFETLDGLRGVAALAVLVAHASAILLGESVVPRQLLAVQFFFMLSGFVMAYSYEQKLLFGMPFRDFILRRVIRLYPMILLGALLGFMFFVANDAGRIDRAAVRLGCGILNVPCLPFGDAD